MATQNPLAAANALCNTLSDEEGALVREMITSLTDKWSLWTLSVLAEAEAPLRFSRVMQRVDGISQKSLTKTLRQLERNGLVTRKMFAEVPPRVEYSMTALGLDMLQQIEPLWIWVAKSVHRFQSVRRGFDEHDRLPTSAKK